MSVEDWTDALDAGQLMAESWYSDTNDAYWKEWRPRIEFEKHSKNYQEELVTVRGTRREFMEKLQSAMQSASTKSTTIS